MAQAAGQPVPPENLWAPETTATDDQLSEARVLAADCARRIAEWRRVHENSAEHVIPLDGLPYHWARPWTPKTAQSACEDVERAAGDAQTLRAQRVERDATQARWTKLAQGDRGDLVRRYGLPNAAETDARLQDRFWVFTRFVNRSQPCTVTYYFKRDVIERIEAEPATCFTAQPR